MQKNKLSIDEIGTLILFAALIFGGLFRFFPTIMAGFPINDGGMFYTMMKDLQVNHFVPPLYTTYNNLHIPFAYPPLALYIGAIISSIFNISLLEILRWLPALINTACIFAFYFLAKEILGDKIKASIAALVFAFTPHLSTWLSAGGGLTRSFGTLFMILTVLYSYKLFVNNNSKSIWGAIIFGSLTVLSHTESTIFAIALPLYIWVTKSRSMKSALQAGLIGLGVFLFAGPWYGLVISRHGPEPLLSALKTGSQTIWSILHLINIDIITEEPYLDLLGVFGIMGIIFLVIKKEYFIPLMLVVMVLAQPRSAHTVGNIPLAMAAGIFIIEVLLPAITNIDDTQNAKNNRGIKVFLFIALPYLLINSVYQGFMLSQNHVSEGEQRAMQWIKENTPEGSQFLVITGESESMCESSAEWFPTLTERTSLATLQGREWLLGSKFGEFIGHRTNLQSCINENMECLEREIKYFAEDFDYIYISIKTPTNNCQAMNVSRQTTRGIVTTLEKSSDYAAVYKTSSVVIFLKK
ncbi:MAG: glycosyltransferase family 39 protein [Anaerolineales bacterium]|nr:glycosyltransferase family 39 protein [Anaerolineales bacterium]